MFANGLPFFVTHSRDIKLKTIEFLPSHTAEQLLSSLESVARLYPRGGFIVKLCLMDMEFKPLEKLSKDIPVNITAAREHVNDIERSIRVIKDRSQSVVSELPYKHRVVAQCLPECKRGLHRAFTQRNRHRTENGLSQALPRKIWGLGRLRHHRHIK
ncbi:hypothetical protein ACHAXN_001495 [Cyclotella atomus]